MQTQKDVTIIGAGIMSATMAVMMKKLMPEAKIAIYEKLDKVAAESSDSWNNAGTGHSAFCELNYTPEQKDGSINIDKALEIASSFEISKQFWAYLKAQNHLSQQDSFIKTVPHMSFVWGEDNISFLKRRHEAMIPYALFEDMKYSEDFDEISSLVPMMMKNRDRDERIGVTRMEAGTDVNFDAITKDLIEYLKSCDGVEVHLNHKVKNFRKQADGSWKIKVKDLNTGKTKTDYSKFVSIGAGGGSLPLLQKSNIKEGNGYGGFPVSGMFLRCTNPEIIKQHSAKVYGKAAEGSPPMSMPHMDERVIEGERSLLFGPYAGLSSKFLKSGSYFDLPGSIRLRNIWPMLAVARHNFGLIKYLVSQALQSPKDRFNTLKLYFPEAKMEDWELYVAGQRVQIMKKDKEKGGVLKLGTEIINSSDGSLAALLGASPGASTAVSTMLEILDKCFPEKMASQDWKNKLKEMVPSYEQSLIDDQQLCRDTRKATAKELNLVE
ncbi:MAG: malate dehydrogenase (quinone) [Bacteroidales bacterium]|nr:malate dehydrogenase (quinone) [Bacteroidales bacterium]